MISKTFAVTLAPSLMVSPEEFYGGYGAALREMGYTTGPRIYMILRRRALRLLQVKSPAHGLLARLFPTCPGGTFHLRFRCQNKVHTIDIPALDLIWNMIPSELKEKHTKAELENDLFAVRNEAHYTKLKLQFGRVLGVELAITDAGKKATFTLYQPSHSPITLPMMLDRFLGASNQSLGMVGEVCYIGQTIDDESHRLEGHKQLVRVLAERRDDEQILVLIGRFVPHRVDVSQFGMQSKLLDITDSDKLSLIEMSLINYFKPTLNITYKNGPGIKGAIVNRALIADGYDSLEIHYDPDNPLMFAGTSFAGYSDEHHITFRREKTGSTYLLVKTEK